MPDIILDILEFFMRKTLANATTFFRFVKAQHKSFQLNSQFCKQMRDVCMQLNRSLVCQGILGPISFWKTVIRPCI